MRGVCLAVFSIKVFLPDDFWSQPDFPRDAVEYFLDDQHALRAAKPAESCIRCQIRFRDVAPERDMRNVVGVVEMENGAICDRAREIERPAGIGKQIDFRAQDETFVIEADAELRQKGMALTGDHHVLIAVQPNSHFSAGLSCSEGAQSG